MNSSHHQLQVYDTGDTFSLDTAVRYEKNTDVESRSQAFHDALVALTTVAGKIPLGLLQRYGLDPLQTYQSAAYTREGSEPTQDSINADRLRDSMQRSVETEILIWQCIKDGQKIPLATEDVVTKSDDPDITHGDTRRPYAIF